MSRLAKRVGLFLLLFVVTLGVLVPFWDLAAPHYERLVAAAARPLFHILERPNVTVLGVDGGELWVFRRLDEQRATPFLYLDRYAFFAVIPLVALFVATPGLGVLRRGARTLGGLAALFAFQILYVVAAVELGYAASGMSTPPAFFARTLDGWQVLVRILWEAGPLLIWIAFSWSAWKRFVRQVHVTDEGAARRWPGAGLGEMDTREGWLA